MRMEDFHCDFLEVSFRVSAEAVDKAALLRETGHEDDERLQVRLVFGSSSNPDTQHAHARVRFSSEKKVRVQVAYHSSPGDVEDAHPPYMEDCAKWLAGFIQDETVSAEVNGSFMFDNSFAPGIPMPFPLLMADERLAGTVVTGLSLTLGKGVEIDKALLLYDEGFTSVSTFTEKEISLKDFDFYAELNRLSLSVMSLVKKQEAKDESSEEE